MPMLMAKTPTKTPTKNSKKSELFAFEPSLFGEKYSFISEKTNVASSIDSSKSAGACDTMMPLKLAPTKPPSPKKTPRFSFKSPAL